jgi:hypothetical protein
MPRESLSQLSDQPIYSPTTMPQYTETNSNGLRARVPLMEQFSEAFPERTPVLTAIKKINGVKTTSPENNSTKVEFPFKTFSPGEIRGVNDLEDFDPALEGENNEDNKTMLATHIQLIRNGVSTGRIAGTVTQQVAGRAMKPKLITTDHKIDMLRRNRESMEKMLVSELRCTPPSNTAGTKVGPYMTDGFAGVMTSETRVNLPTPSMAQPTQGQMLNLAAVTDFSEAKLNDMLAALWGARETEGNWHFFVNPDLQRVINDSFLCFGPQTSTSLPLRRVNIDGGKETIKVSVKSYESTFGTVNMSLHAKLPKALTLNGCVTVNGSKEVTVTSNAKLYPGMPVTGTGIAAGTRIAAVPSKKQASNKIYLDTAATAPGTVALAFGETVFGEAWDFDFARLGFLDEVGYVELEPRGGSTSGYTDSLLAHCLTNPQAMGIVRKSQAGYNGVAA